MKKLLALLILLAGPAVAQTTRTFPAQETNNTFSGTNQFTLGHYDGPVTFANLPAAPANGTQIYVSNGSQTNPCTGGGTGALATRVNGVWNCASGGATLYVNGVVASTGLDGSTRFNGLENGTNISITDLGAGLIDISLAGGVTVTNGGTGSNTHTAHATMFGNGASPFTEALPGTAGGVLTSNGPSADPSYALTGVAPNASTCPSNVYTVVSGDRVKYLTFSDASACAVTLPSAASFGSNFVFVTCNIGAGTVTITPTTSTISSTSGFAYTSGAASLALKTGQCAWIYSDNTNYFAIMRNSSPETYNHSGTVQAATHLVRDRCTLGTDCSVTLTGAAVFTSSSTYDCAASDRTAANPVMFAPSSGSAFALTGTGTDTISYLCFGN